MLKAMNVKNLVIGALISVGLLASNLVMAQNGSSTSANTTTAKKIVKKDKKDIKKDEKDIKKDKKDVAMDKKAP